MEVFDGPEVMRRWSDAAIDRGERVVLVPTMGFLHDGHLHLVRHARGLGDRVVVSIFVNPTQFGPNEDLARYPRDLDGDLAKLGDVDAVFVPTPATIYSPNFDTYVTPDSLAASLCGATRPTHFRGVCTVVAILFRITRCAAAVFGEKDFQQLQIIRRMVRDLWLDVEVAAVPTVREADGLAMSSRNALMTAEERRRAPVLAATLRGLRDRVQAGEVDVASLLRWGRGRLESEGRARVDYLSVVDPETLQPLSQIDGAAHAAAAAFFGQARLIDNLRLS